MESRPGITRRDLMKNAALALPALAALPRFSFASEQPAAGGPKKKVIVVGAGLAGLAAAYELVQLGHEVSVVEAQTRPGGRVYTLRSPFSDGLYAEAGAISFSDSFHHMLRYVKTFGLPSAPIGPRGPAVFHLRGKRLTPKQGEKPDWPYELAADEKGQGIIPLLIKYFTLADKLGDPTAADWRPEAFKEWDQVTLAQWMAAQGASPGAIELLGNSVWWGHGWEEVSALHRLTSDVALFLMGQKAYVIPGGTDLLAQAFARALRDRISYGVPVVAIEQTANGVAAIVRQGGSEERMTADRLIVTAPLPAVRKIRFTPELGAARRKAIESLEYSPVTRVYLQSRRRFWADAGDGGAAWTDLPIGAVAEHPFARAEDAGPRSVLECHVKGDKALRLAGMDEAERLASSAREMEKVHPGFLRNVEGGASYVWSSDPWAGGGYPVWKPGQLLGWLPELARPEARIHFAGEHTSWLSRTMEGALESGNRAAKEVHEAA
ncbi:MAG TPA: NAD(P)/FAD-dependent oxidoreductase [Thermoanaerobaculia bacterium]|jgi:monoamine oxidase|nr:NAD(P)/FAD-dependent oxidoreductase [Thermoanaerobaculia bacterium]